MFSDKNGTLTGLKTLTNKTDNTGNDYEIVGSRNGPTPTRTSLVDRT